MFLGRDVHTVGMITRFLIYGALGCLMEVLWTGLGALLQKNFKLQATTSIWMFFIYGMVVFFEPLINVIGDWHIFLRGVMYALCIFAAEFAAGSLLKRADLCPWDYSRSRFHFKGLIRLDYAPAWAVAGLFFERVYSMLV